MKTAITLVDNTNMSTHYYTIIISNFKLRKFPKGGIKANTSLSDCKY